MSWNIELKDKNNNTIADIGNYTYNVNPMYKKALNIGGLSNLNEKSAKDIIELLEKGINNMKTNPEEYKKLNPANGWGNYEGALNYLEKIYKECKSHYKSYIYIC